MLRESGVAFGTSGARGLVEQFTDEVCAAFTMAFLTVMREQGEVTQVVLGMDRRPSSPGMASACTTAAKAMGIELVDYGVLPTPALALQAMAGGVPAIMITGSHIPFDRNGIKFYRPEGEITKADEQAILSVTVELPLLGAIAREPESDAARRRYIARYTEWFSGRPLVGKRVGLYQHSAAGRDLNVQVLEALGAEVVILGRSERFVPVDTEAVSEADRGQARHWAAEYRLDALLTTDGDGDRPLLADERGEWLRGDIVGLLCARELGIQALAVPVSCNSGIEDCGAFQMVQRTRIGSPYVLAGMEELTEKYARVAGFEANGGFLLGCAIEEGDRRLEALPTRDALLPALTLMVAAACRQAPLSALAEALPARYTASDRLKEFPTERSLALLANWRNDLPAMRQALGLEFPVIDANSIDGLRVTLENREIVHLRPSGNAPELRCYVESQSEERASALVERVLARLDAQV
ncbi:phosphomannomutase [Salinicola peritrichatus]|uniref:phosphomannomutase n=1 Tax=Salinicola peritrichatus TaxID=1267424 RepID=UPI001EF769E0|nr:phosphomannomutase [Salinicola peritrichatus]